MRTFFLMPGSPQGSYFLPAVLTSFLLFAPLVGGGMTATAMLIAFQRMSSTGDAINISVLASPMATALLWTAIGIILWLIGLGSFLFLTLKLNYKRVWFWRVAVASSLLLFSSAIVVALPTLCFLVFGRSRFLPGHCVES